MMQHKSNGSELPLVSVIIPIYNVEKYIERCVQSVLNQDYEKIEVILVDDGTKDSSDVIIDRLAAEDVRVIVIHKKNGGVSSARNKGLQVAKGEYILFVDGDDYVENDYVSYLVSLIRNAEGDVALSKNHFSHDNNKQISGDEQRVASAEEVIESIYLGSVNVAVWNKVYRREFLLENNLFFDPSVWYGEGMLFNIKCLQYTECVAVGERKLYHQVFNPESAMRNFSLESNFCGIRSLKMQKALWVKRNEKIEKAWTYHYRCFANSILCGLVKTNTVGMHMDVYRKCIKVLRTNIHVPMQVNIPLKRKLYYLIAWICPVLLAKRNAWAERRLFKNL